jgi:nucleoside-diphosphate kinase
LKRIVTLFLTTFSFAFCQASEQNENTNENIEQTLSIVKPDAVEANHIGAIVHRLENGGLKVVAAKMTRLTKEEAGKFYGSLKDRPFYNDLVAYMSSGPIFVQILQGPSAIDKNRTMMGATDPKKAAPGTIRAEFGTDIEHNAVHGSDSPENAKKEIAFFFVPQEIYSR